MPPAACPPLATASRHATLLPYVIFRRFRCRLRHYTDWRRHADAASLIVSISAMITRLFICRYIERLRSGVLRD